MKTPSGIVADSPQTSELQVRCKELLAALFEQFRAADEAVREREREIMDRDPALASLRRTRDIAWWKYENSRKESAANGG